MTILQEVFIPIPLFRQTKARGSFAAAKYSQFKVRDLPSALRIRDLKRLLSVFPADLILRWHFL